MTSNEFWKENPDLFWAYRFSYYKKRKEKNYFSWLQGKYIYEAVSVALSNAFTKQNVYYSTVPYGEEPQKINNENTLEILLKSRVKEVQKIMEKQQ